MEEVYIKYSKLIYRYLYSLSNNRDLSEELMQETFYCAIKNIDSFKNECNIYSWLCQIAKNKWINYQAKNSKMEMLNFDDSIENLLTENFVEDTIMSQNEQTELHKKIQTLDSISREVIYLRINGELPFKEIGKILNKSEVLTRTIFYRAKFKLKERFKNEERM